MQNSATMQRLKLIYMLHSFSPSSEEVDYKQKILNFVESNPDCFERFLGKGHVTASAWLLNKDRDKALLMHHAKLDQWFQLGGHCDGNHDVLAVAMKEASEESGFSKIIPISQEIFDIDIHLIPANKHEQSHYHYDIRFLLQSLGDEELTCNRESKELRWIGKEKKDLPTDNLSVSRMFHKWIKLL